MSKKIVLKVGIDCEKCKRKAMKTVAGIEGVDSITFDEKDNKITVIGDADPVCLTASLRRFVSTDLVSVGPSK
uniref:HMA domain-containing protein n=1 Tax=Picea sitchensis TaxID=3332 RepID=B8LNZ1_PICSI|nr:unknown [Picea sitchensis]